MTKRMAFYLPLATALLQAGALAGGVGGPAPVPQPAAVQPIAALTEQWPLTGTVRRTVLSNGLTVLTKEVHGAPVVSVQVFYKIGSRNEAAGVNGIAHQLEHMLFKGTAARPVQFGRLLSALGADFNAFTYYDQTAYHETLEREKAGAALTLEADRMVNATIDKKGLESEKNVVLSEIEGDENSPAYRLGRAVQAAAFGGSPYGLTVGGTRKDIEKFDAAQVSAYYRKYYAPQYATLIVVGDFNTADMLRQIEQTFGKLGRAGTPPVVLSEPLTGSANEATLGRPVPPAPIMLRGEGATALLSAVYPLPDLHSSDTAALRVLDYLLLSGRSSVLYQSLFEKGVAADGGTYPYQFARGGWYSFDFTPAAGVDVRALDKALEASIAQLRQKPLDKAEVERARNQVISQQLLGLRSVENQAQQLGMDATSAGDYQYTDKLLRAIAQVTPADVQRVAQQYLAPQRRTVGYFEPQKAAQDTQAAAAGAATQEAFNAGPPVDPQQVAKYLPPAQAATHAVTLPQQITLSNGLRVLLLRDTSTPTVTLSALVQAGREYDTDKQAGLSDLVAQNLLSGTQGRSELELAKVLDGAGASLNVSVNRTEVLLSGAARDQNLPTLLDVLGDVLQRPTFPKAQFEASRLRATQTLKQQEDDPSYSAQKAFRKALYPAGNPWQVFSTAQSLQGLQVSDAQQFYATHYRPERTILTLVGNFDPLEARTLIERELGQWQVSTPAAALSYGLPRALGSVEQRAVSLPGKTQAVTYLGMPSIARNDPRYYAAQVLNDALGGSTLSSRLGTELRDKGGLTYGVYSSFSALKNAGPFSVVMQTNPKDTRKAVAGALNIMQQVRQSGLSSSEVSTSKNSLASGYTVALANPETLAQTLSSLLAMDLPLNEFRDYQAKLGAVTPQQVSAAARELLDPTHVAVVTAGPPQP